MALLSGDSADPNRVDADDVHKIVDLDSDVDLSLFIRMAHMMTNMIPADADCLNEETLCFIELYLSAHFAVSSNSNQMLLSEKAGDTDEKYMFKAGENLAATTYGQQAKVLDCTGTLDKLDSDKPLKSIFRVFPLKC